MGWGLFLLGDTHKNLGNYKKAKILLDQSLKIYKKNYGNSNVEIAKVLRSLGEVYLLERNMEMAEDFFKKALIIFRDKKHPGAYSVLEGLSDIYAKKDSLAALQANVLQSQDFKLQSIEYLKQAQEITEKHFPVNAPQVIRIQSKLKKLKDQ